MRQNKPWVIVLAIVLFTGPMWLSKIGLGAASFDPPPGESNRIGWSADHDIAADLFERLNDERVARGLPRLAWDARLAAVALDWTEHMISAGIYEHSTPEFRAVAGFPLTGENIHMGPLGATDAHIDWMESEGHRENILRNSFVAVGIGAICRHDGHLWATQVFGGVPMSAAPPSVDTGPDKIIRSDPGPRCQPRGKFLPDPIP